MASVDAYVDASACQELRSMESDPDYACRTGVSSYYFYSIPRSPTTQSSNRCRVHRLWIKLTANQETIDESGH